MGNFFIDKIFGHLTLSGNIPLRTSPRKLKVLNLNKHLSLKSLNSHLIDFLLWFPYEIGVRLYKVLNQIPFVRMNKVNQLGAGRFAKSEIQFLVPISSF